MTIQIHYNVIPRLSTTTADGTIVIEVDPRPDAILVVYVSAIELSHLLSQYVIVVAN